MAGSNTPYDMTYLTAPVEYRTNITDVDVSPLLDSNGDDIPDIRADIDLSKKVYDEKAKYAPQYNTSSRAYNTHLELYVHLDFRGEAPRSAIVNGLVPESYSDPHANLCVWAWSGAPGIDGRWCAVFEQSVVTDTVLVVRNVPNTKYRVTVTELTDATVASIVEQHTI